MKFGFTIIYPPSLKMKRTHLEVLFVMLSIWYGVNLAPGRLNWSLLGLG